MKYVVVIPARFKSSRFPGKPMVHIAGIPMLVRTYDQCKKAVDSSLIYVATEDEVIRDMCEEHNIQVLMTSDTCMTGTDRVAEVAEMIQADVYINVQGDEPLFDPDDLRRIIEEATLFPNDVINGYCKLTTEEQYRSTSIPKAVFRSDGRLLYMSRAGIPSSKSGGDGIGYRQVCAYAFPRQALREFVSVNTKTFLEGLEDIEILRFLEMGREVRMIELGDQSIAVDFPEDIKKIESVLIAREV